MRKSTTEVYLHTISKEAASIPATMPIQILQSRFGIGVGLGYKVVSSKGIVFDIGLVEGRAFIDNTTYEDDSLGTVEIDWPEIMFMGKLAVGYNFGSANNAN